MTDHRRNKLVRQKLLRRKPPFWVTTMMIRQTLQVITSHPPLRCLLISQNIILNLLNNIPMVVRGRCQILVLFVLKTFPSEIIYVGVQTFHVLMPFILNVSYPGAIKLLKNNQQPKAVHVRVVGRTLCSLNLKMMKNTVRKPSTLA